MTEKTYITEDRKVALRLPQHSPFVAQPEMLNESNLHPEKILQETKGERYFKVLRFGIAEAAVLTLSAFTAYWSRMGSSNRYLNKFKTGFDYIDNVTKTIIGEGDYRTRIHNAISNSVITGTGGTLFTPFFYALEHSKTGIVSFFNRHFSSSEEVAIGEIRTQSEAKPSLLNVLTSRFVSYFTVSAAFFGADMALGKGKDGVSRLMQYEQWGGDQTANAASRTLKALGRQPLNATEKNNVREFGKLLSLDIFGATASVTLWTTLNSLFARRGNKQAKAQQPEVLPVENVILNNAAVVQQVRVDGQFTQTIKPRIANGFQKIEPLASIEHGLGGIA